MEEEKENLSHRKNDESLILVYYISTLGLDPDEIGEYMEKIMKRIGTSTLKNVGEMIFLPVQGDSKIECINPKYISNSDLIKKHERLMSELHEHFNFHLENNIDE